MKSLRHFKLFAIVLVSIVFGGFGGYYLFRLSPAPQMATTPPPEVAIGKKSLNAPPISATYENGYKEGVTKGQDEAMKAVNEALIRRQIIKYPLDPSLNVAVPIYELWGFVQEVKSDGFIVQYGTSQFFDLGENRLATTDVKIDSSSTIYILSTSIAPSIQDQEKSSGGGGGAVVVNSDKTETANSRIIHEKKNLTLNDLKRGDYVRLTSTEDVKSATAIQATEIQLYPLKENPYLKGEFNGSYEFLPFSVHVSQEIR